jgi:2-polyprenyl-6-methoxyphenol hydroxylase-like FAD-dependent oxidoreductase
VKERVLIVGGGIAGLALAPTLARNGAAVEVIERAPAWRVAGTGMYLPGNAARALRALGLEAPVASAGVEIPLQRFSDHRGRLLCEVDVAALWATVGPCLAVHRTELHALLREAADDVPIRLGLSVQQLAKRDDVVSVVFNDGTAATTTWWSARTGSRAPSAGWRSAPRPCRDPWDRPAGAGWHRDPGGSRRGR